jgi:hypothetical protein
MSCIKLPEIVAPDLSILLPPLDIPLPNIHIGLSLCCELSLPPIPGIPPSLNLIPGVALILVPVNVAILAAVDELNALLDSIQVSCPLE